MRTGRSPFRLPRQPICVSAHLGAQEVSNGYNINGTSVVKEGSDRPGEGSQSVMPTATLSALRAYVTNSQLVQIIDALATNTVNENPVIYHSGRCLPVRIRVICPLDTGP